MSQGEQKQEFPKYLSIKQVMEITTLSRTTIYALMDSRKLGFTRIGSRRLVPADALQKLLAAGTFNAQG